MRQSLNAQILVLTALPFVLCACGKHPSEVSGVWKAGASGMFSSQMILVLKSDGKFSLDTQGGIRRQVSGAGTWEFDKDSLVLTDKKSSEKLTFVVISKGKSELILKHPSGPLITFSRSNDA